ncbi:hypothetical protein HPB51_023757 [Rhipicephalus microplus]|uniref:Uncharacterized protein n=1 Tax=Rhipicephalus microplus TaxID=6941 RepID=A0A9J6E543_RHIMP|nr:hypothetical protein HPB51_023757 [Rhipicephalus microplus]
MKLQQDESLGKPLEDACFMTFSASVQRFSETDEEDKRCSGTERPFDTCPLAAKTLRNQPISQTFNTIRGGSNSVICCGVAGDLWSINHALETLGRCRNAFVTEDTEEERCRALRWHFMLSFGAGRPIGRRFPFHGAYTRPRRLFVIVEGKLVLARRRSIPCRGCQRTHCHSYIQRDSETPGGASKVSDRRRSRYPGIELAVPPSTLSCVDNVVALVRHGRRSARKSPRPGPAHETGESSSSPSSSERWKQERDTGGSLLCCDEDETTMTSNFRGLARLALNSGAAVLRDL